MEASSTDNTMNLTSTTDSIASTIVLNLNDTFYFKPNSARNIFDANGGIRIPLYTIIFLTSVIGNGLVILTLLQNRRMRTVTNVFLLNLSVSDLLLAVFCMPFTLIPLLLRNFVFGEFMCVAIRYLQAVSVCVSCYTLVAISMERFFAICHPLQSRQWQTLSHAYRLIVLIWILSFILMIPIAIGNELISLRTGNHACREIWSKQLRLVEIIYSISLAVILLVIPLFVMMLAYGGISNKLWFTMTNQVKEQSESADAFIEKSSEIDLGSSKVYNIHSMRHISLRQSNQLSSNTNRKRVIKMLFVIVFEYFICWSPLYVLNTWKVVDYMTLHGRLSDTAWSFVLLLSYSSSCIHPITYCFMNKNFRKGFLGVFPCFPIKIKTLSRSCTEVSNISNMNSLVSPSEKSKTKGAFIFKETL